MKTIKTRSKNQRYPLVIVTLIILLAITAYLYRFSFLELVELKTLDLRFLYRGKVPASSQVVLADIDEKSLDREGKWPWPRDKLAALVTKISNAGAKVLAFDIGFFEPDQQETKQLIRDIKTCAAYYAIRQPEFIHHLDQLDQQANHDLALAQAIAYSKAKIVLGLFFHMNAAEVAHINAENVTSYEKNARAAVYQGLQTAPGATFNFPLHEKIEAALPESNIDIVTNAAEYAGYFNLEPDYDGVVRWMKAVIQYKDKFYAPLALKALSAYYDEDLWLKIEDFGISRVAIGDRTIPTDNLGQIMVNYHGKRPGFDQISATDILNDRIRPNRLKGKIVLLGVTVTAVYDLRVTPFGVQPGLIVHASLIDSVLRNDFLSHPPGHQMYNILAIILAGLILGLILPRTGAIWGLLSALSLCVAYYQLCQMLFNQFGIILNLIYPLCVMVLVYIAITAYRYLMEEGQKRFIRNAFSTYLAPSVVEQLVESPEKLVLGGEQRDITAFFSDLQGFTSISENLAPTKLVELLNAFLTEMTDIIYTHEGTVDKFEGDAIIAFFGAPNSLSNHAERAVMACIEMQKRMARLRGIWRPKGWPELKMRIGLYTGPAVVGNMGSKSRMDYTMMGDTVNIAARLEGVNKSYGIYTLIGETTYQSTNNDILSREIDAITVVGKKQPVKIYQPFDWQTETPPPIQKLFTRYAQGLEAYRKRDWDKAVSHFKSALDIIPDDGPSKTMLARSRAYKISPPPANWDGAYNMLTK